MTATTTNDIKKQRLLRMTLSHYKNEECSEEAMHRFVSEEHAVNAAKIHVRHGMEAYGIVYTPSAFRLASKQLNAALGDKWVIRDYDVQVEFYFRDMATLSALAADPDFHAMQALEGPIVSRTHVEQSIGWVETYIQDGKLVNVTDKGKPTYPGFEEMSAAP
ncbi:EthD domain-containing protein [Microdochium nivale]|nr:EthD domain-containing protein [Microdochium nivale]